MSLFTGCFKIDEGTSSLKDAFKAYSEGSKAARNTLINNALDETLSKLNAAYKTAAEKACATIKKGIEEIRNAAGENKKYDPKDEGLANAVELVKAAGEDDISLELLEEIASQYKDNGLALDALIAVAKNENTKKYFEVQKYDMNALADDALRGTIDIELEPVNLLIPGYEKITPLTKRAALIDETCINLSNAISDKYFEIRLLYGARY